MLDDLSAIRRQRGDALVEETLSVRTRSVYSALGLAEDDLDALLAAEAGRGSVVVTAWQLSLARAESCWLRSRRCDSAAERGAWQLASVLWAREGLQQTAATLSAFDPAHRLLIELHNHALARWFLGKLAQEGAPCRWRTASTPFDSLDLAIDGGPGSWAADYFDEFLAADTLAVDGLDRRQVRFGIGAAMVGVRHNAPPVRPTRELFLPEGIVQPVTVVLEPEESTRLLRLRLCDPWRTNSVQMGGVAFPLQADFTAAVAVQMARAPWHELERRSMLLPDEFDGHSGIYLIEPYTPAKTPVLLVHGMMSSPLTWRELVNEFVGDPRLRDRFQLWLYMYPSGTPLLKAHADLRRALQRAQRCLDPDRRHAASTELIVVGHSVGSLMAKMLTQSSGDVVWRSMFERPPGELDIPPGDRQELSEMMFFEALPQVKRVVFVATPHRGTDYADSLVGQMGALVMRLPARFERIQERLRDRNPGAALDGSPAAPPSVVTLSPRHPLMSALAGLPLGAGTVFHTIVGSGAHGSDPAAGDGYVELESSRLQAAVSECVVPCGHRVNGHPLAVAEVLRILHLHLLQQAAGHEGFSGKRS